MYYNFRDPELTPCRMYTGEPKSHYRYYKEQLREDFHHHCGYTFCSDGWFGGKNCFHIDHLKPKMHHPELMNDYNNLVYSCPTVNIAKGADCTYDYLDPCTVDFNLIFARNRQGRIIVLQNTPNRDIAEHMYKKMKLYLTRYALIWWLDCLHLKIKEVETITEQLPSSPELDIALLNVYRHYHKLISILHES